jgi:hypothetical protein
MGDPKHAKIWSESLASEFGQFVQGTGGRVKGTNTIFFIQKNQVPILQYKRLKGVVVVVIVVIVGVIGVYHK